MRQPILSDTELKSSLSLSLANNNLHHHDHHQQSEFLPDRKREVLSEVKKDNRLNFFVVKEDEKTRYVFIDDTKYGIVWKNVFAFLFLHFVYFGGLIHLFRAKLWNAWIFGYWYGIFGLVGITCGAHRLWSHKSYKATLPLRIFLMMCQSLAGQNDLYTWCRDHRLHHKFSETDADPHNSKRGFFFCHVGWLLTRKHPDIMLKGKTLDCSDLLKDPVIRFQRRFYTILGTFFCFVLPTLICHYLLGESWFDSWITGAFGRYIVTLHCTWFVNSAAHMWGDQPYNSKIEPRENKWVSYATMGEGFHNYHHVFPFDYTISEMGWKFNPMKQFIDVMASIGLAYDLKRAPRRVVENTKKRVIKENQEDCDQESKAN